MAGKIKGIKRIIMNILENNDEHSKMGLFHHSDWFPTILAAAGEPGIKEKLLKGHRAGKKTYNVHLDSYDQTALLSGKGPGARKEFFYITDDGDFAAFRYNKWKISFLTQECNGFDVWD